ncbi:MAG: hypothetical protein KKD11_02540, partial [Candidatus Omnitrophica bacterium]|nr:hypothetical protein [Candidatus Omnitrophota bacterium]
FSEKGEIYLGTRAGLFVSNDNGITWQKDPGEAGNLSIRWIIFTEAIVLVAAETGVYNKTGSGWNRILVTQTEEAEYDSDSTDAAESAIKPVNSIFTKDKDIFLATDDGIFISDDKGDSWNRFASNGLLSQKINRVLFKDNLYAVTDRGIFVFLDKSKMWRSLYKGISGDRANSISVDNKGSIWVATNKGLYTDRRPGLNLAYADGQEKGIDEEDNLLNQFSHEPTIREVQEDAIKYAEVHPDKIKQWRSAASKKALLPDVSVGVDRYVTDYWHWDAGQNPDVLQKGDDVLSWDVTASWDLGDLIWSTDQTSIDTRSRLMVQLRDDILDEITRTYFERRRLQIELQLSPPSDLKNKMESALRIEELTADLDAMTGGYFSKVLKETTEDTE